MKVGDKVVCVSTEGFWHEPYPKKGDICTIRKAKEWRGVLYLQLEGYVYEIPGVSYDGIGNWCAFSSQCFRPIDYSFGEKVCEEIVKQTEELVCQH